MLHARPHLATHSRADGHSSVAGAAYRLGLKLRDRRLQRTFDFRKRDEGNEIVFATTVAPPGAPLWATDPLELWNRVEAAEKRRDAQVARDYRVPLPLGLSDPDVIAMAIEIAEYIARKLTTPVSIGVHRDAPITAFGEAKAADEIGCHAHLYFPSRKILLDDEAIESRRSGGTGMGDKLSFLSNKSTSGYFVDDVNRFWAEAANRYAAAVGLTPDYDHRSYRRQGLKVRPQPRMGEAATAMERSGRRTERGDRVREAQVMAAVFRRVKAAGSAAAPTLDPLLEAEARRANRPRPSPGPAPRPTSGSSGGSRRLPEQIIFRLPVPAQPSVTADGPAQTQTLTERFRERYFIGLEEGDRPEATFVFRLVVIIDRAIQRLRQLGPVVRDAKAAIAEAQHDHLNAKGELSDWQAGPRNLDGVDLTTPSLWDTVMQQVGQWVNPPDPIIVRQEAERRASVEQRLTDRVEQTARTVQALQDEAEPARREVAIERGNIQRSLRELHGIHEPALPQLFFASTEDERVFIEKHWPELLGPLPEVAPERRKGSGSFGAPTLTPRLPRVRR